MQEGHAEAFSQICERYQPWLLQKITLMVGRREVAEDCASDILEKVLVNISKWRMTYTLNSWISFIAKRYMVDYSRKPEWKDKLRSVSLDFNICSGEGDNELPLLGAILADESAVSDALLMRLR